jgi:hypothetical protein
VEDRRAREVTEENSRGLSDMAADAERWWEVFEMEHREQFEVLTLLHARGSELCHAIIGPPWVRNYLSEGNRVPTLRHTKMV